MELNFIKVQDKDFETVTGLVMDLYNRHLKRYFSEKGDEKFKKTASSKELKKRISKGTHVYLIQEDDELVGMLEFDSKMINQFFIVDEFRGRGYGRMAINWLRDFFSENQLGNEIHVLAFPNAYLGFEKMGFEAVGPEKTDDICVSKKMKIEFQ